MPGPDPRAPKLLRSLRNMGKGALLPQRLEQLSRTPGVRSALRMRRTLAASPALPSQPSGARHMERICRAETVAEDVFPGKLRPDPTAR